MLHTGCSGDGASDGETAMPADSIQALLALDAGLATADSTVAAAIAPPSKAQQKQRQERDSIIRTLVPKSEVCKLACPELLERYREAVELSVSKKDDSKLQFFINNANDPCLQACKKKAETLAEFKALDKKLNESGEEEDIF